MTNFFGHYKADNRVLERSRLLATPANDTYNVIKVPRYAFVLNVYLYVQTAFGALGSVTVGFTGNGEVANATYFLDAALANATDAGMRQADIAKYFPNAAGMITVTTVAGGGAGTLLVFADYCVIH